MVHSEQAIMLCKAALMGDVARFGLIEAEGAARKVKALGRQVRPWKQQLWDASVLEVAASVVRQKFEQVGWLGALLLSTGDALLCEATTRDRNWGTGCDLGSPEAVQPHLWIGANILGWALMEARAHLRRQQQR